MRSVKVLSIAIALFAVMTMNGCKKDGSNSKVDTTSVTDNAIAENESNKVVDAINTVAADNGIGKIASPAEIAQDSMFSPCATITIDSLSAGKTITIDFGTTPCQCTNWDNKFRKGKIIASWTGAYHDSGTVISISTEDYYAGYSATTMNKYDYLKTVTNEGHNANGNLHFSVVVSNATITLYTGQTITWQATRDREWIQGESTVWPFDDVYMITGSGSGIDRNGNPFTITIVNPLKVEFCPWIVSGTVNITHGNLPTRVLDYGDGQCDNQATITVNGVTTTINL